MSSAQTKRLTILQGTTFSEDFSAIDEDGIPVNLTGGTLDMQIRDVPLGAAWATSSGGQITLTATAPTGGAFTVTIADTVTKAFYFREAYYDIRLTVGGVVTRLFEGRVRIDPQITL